MMFRRFALITLALLAVLVACNTPSPVIPTAVSLDALATDQAATRTAEAPAPPTLPPTWTPTLTPTLTPEPPTSTLSPEPPAQSRDRLLFVVDGAVYIVVTDGTGLTALTDAIGARDLSLSPEGRRVALVGAGLGSGSEIYFIDLETDTARQVSSLGYAEVVDPSWHPNGEFLAFAATQYPGAARQIYTMRPDGRDLMQRTSFTAEAEDAQGTQEALVTDEPTVVVEGLTAPFFTPDGRQFIFANPGLRLFDLATGRLLAVTVASGWGNDADPQWRPGTNELVYIRPEQNAEGELSGLMHVIDLDDLAPQTIPPTLLQMPARQFAWSADGEWLVFNSENRVHLMDFTTRSARLIADVEGTLTDVAVSPDGRRVAYVSSDGIASVEVAVFRLGDREPQVIATLDGQQIGELLWIAAPQAPVE